MSLINVSKILINVNNQESSTKICTKCNIEKSFSEFYKDKRGEYGLISMCKKCTKIRCSKNRKTEKGVISIIYSAQKQSSKRRNHQPPNYTKQELTVWLYENGFKKLYDNWVISGYKKDLRPSCDRDNDFKGYSFDNMSLTTWEENAKKGYNNRTNATSTNGIICKPVNQYTLEGVFIQSFESMVVADKKTNTNKASISACCRGVEKTAGGFKWEYSKQ